MKAKAQKGIAAMDMTIPALLTPGEVILPLVYIEWMDSASIDGWFDASSVDILTPYHCRTLAFLVKETELHIVVAQTENYSIDAQFKKLYNGLFSIPKGSITRILRTLDQLCNNTSR